MKNKSDISVMLKEAGILFSWWWACFWEWSMS